MKHNKSFSVRERTEVKARQWKEVQQTVKTQWHNKCQCRIEKTTEIIDFILQQIMKPNLFQQNTVDLSEGQWTEFVSLQVRDITHWAVRELHLYDNSRVTMVKEIGHIHFTALSWLHLSDNEIESIEGLARVQMAHIQKLFLGSNNITRVGMLRKASWPALSHLNISKNYFTDAKMLVQGSFPKIQTLYVYSVWGDKNQWIEQCFPIKLQATFLQKLSIQEEEFCVDRSIKGVMQKRWPDVEIE